MLYPGLVINSLIVYMSLASQDRNFNPPPLEKINNTHTCIRGYGNDSSINCNGAHFVPSRGFYQPCSRHSHCYKSREPSDWCVMTSNYRWLNAGCHCDKKLKSCLIERYDSQSRHHEWAYCTPNNEFYCENWLTAGRNLLPH